MLRLAMCLMLLSACVAQRTGPIDRQPPPGSVVETGRMKNAAIAEASGLTLSHRRDGRLWTMNDGGSPPVLYAMAADGTDHGSVLLTNANNVDWEDLASFEIDGHPWLLVADIGDNLAEREQVVLYLVEEPDLSQQDVMVTSEIAYRYPDGPKDAEAAAVDASAQLVYVLSKRTLPPRLYSIPLLSGDANASPTTATLLGAITSIPAPTQDDIDGALAANSWHWQPTAMDFSADGATAVILTYRAAYLYDRRKGESWWNALQRSPVAFDLGNVRGAEAATLDVDSVIVTVEAQHAPLFRIGYRP